MHSVDGQWKDNQGVEITDLSKDFSDGRYLCMLIEDLSKCSVGKWHKHPVVIPQKMDNLALALNFISKSGINLINIGTKDIMDGNIKSLLGLLWQMIIKYEIMPSSKEGSDKGAKAALLEWVNSQVSPDYSVANFTKDWHDGRVLCALVNAIEPGMCPDHLEFTKDDADINCELGILLAEKLGINRFFEPAALYNGQVDEKSMMVYVAQLKNYIPVRNNAILLKKEEKIIRIKAYGSGLQEGVVKQESSFIIETEDSNSLEVFDSRSLSVKVFTKEEIVAAETVHSVNLPAFTKYAGWIENESKIGDSKIGVIILDPKGNTLVPNSITNSKGVFSINYTPQQSGHHEIALLFREKHVESSPYLIPILENESLGGEGRIRVFFSTTSFSAKYKEDRELLEELLTEKKIHLRKDFEAWHPIDLLPRNDREAIFRKAGTRVLPIVFIDDKYVGDYDAIKAKNDSGELDKILKFNASSYISESEHFSRLLSIAADESNPDEKKDSKPIDIKRQSGKLPWQPKVISWKSKNESPKIDNKSVPVSNKTQIQSSPSQLKRVVTDSFVEMNQKDRENSFSLNQGSNIINKELEDAILSGILDKDEIEAMKRRISQPISESKPVSDSHHKASQIEGRRISKHESEIKSYPNNENKVQSVDKSKQFSVSPSQPLSVEGKPVAQDIPRPQRQLSGNPLQKLSITPYSVPVTQVEHRQSNSISREPWACSVCTYINPPLFLCCEICGTQKKK